MNTSLLLRSYSLNFVNRLFALALIAVLLAPVILVNPGQKVSANPSRIKTEQPAPPSAPPEPFLIAAGDSSSTSFIAASIVSVQNFFAMAKAPEGLEIAKVPTFGEKMGSYFGSFFGLFTSSAKPAAPAPPPPPPPAAPVDFDFDNDNMTDRGRWHPATQEFKVKKSSDGSYLTYTLGTSSSAKAAPGDYDGDGDVDAGVFLNGAWKYKTTTGGSEQTVNWGTTGDIPVAGNYTGNARTEFAVYRPSTGYWWITNSTDWSYYGVALGNSTDIPVVGDYDGDGLSDPAVFRPSNGTWYIQGSSVGYYSAPWGLAVDVPVPADYDGDGKTDMAVFRPTTGDWYAYSSQANNGTYINVAWGNYGDQPVPGYYNSDNKADFAIWRPTTGAWFTMTNETTPTYDYQLLGVPGDQAVPSAYIKQIGSTVSANDLNTERLKPRNATGGTDLYSQNFAWSSGLVGLPGRSGLNAGFGMGYNSLVWIRQGNSMIFDPDTSNISPGFRFGFPTIEPVYYDSAKSTFAYMMVTPSGGRVEFRQTSVGNTYETADSSYTQLVTTGASSPNDPVEDITIKVTTTDGTQMSYIWKAGAFRCTQIKDRNGNYTTNTYDDYGALTTVTDTLGRVITVNYDGGGYPTSITQTWKDSNGSGSNVTHNWATFTYTTIQIDTNFVDGSALNVFGPPDGTYVKVLQKVERSDGSYTTFDYNTWGQVKQINNYADDDHKLNHVGVNLPANASSSQTDCPRFTETKSYIENFNSGSEITVNNSLTTGQTYSLPGSISGSATRIQVWMTGHPDNLRSNTFVGASGWNEGLPIATEDCLTTTSTCSDRKRWTWTEWTQDNTGLSYPLNPRVIESRVGDGTNTKRSTTSYYEYSGTDIAVYGLPLESIVYKSDLTTTEKKVIYGYNLDNAYTSRRIIGLPYDTHVYGYGQDTSTLDLISKTTYNFDEGNFSDSGLDQNISPVQHDSTNYSSSFIVGRGNLTSVTRWDVNYPNTSGYAVTSSQKYNTAGSVVSKTDPLSRTVKIAYTDNFNSTVSGSTYAYPTTLTDPASNSSTVKYRYDIGANVEATSPAPAGNTYGKTSKRIFDAHGRLERNSVYINTTEHSYVRYEYPTTGIESKVYAPIIDADNDGNIAEDEVLSTSLHDGAGRVRMSRTENPGSTGGFTGQKIEYDILGRVHRQSVPTEIDSGWNAAGDDYTRGFLWTYQKYDWMGRVIRKINTDGVDSPTANDSDVFITYDGCGCAGSKVTTIEGELVPTTVTSPSTARRKQKIYEDPLGRAFKQETYEWDGTTVYSTVVKEFNGRDQVTELTQITGTSGTSQATTSTYDGHGRLKTHHRPEQIDDTTNPDTPTYTTYYYNNDDSVSYVVDGRGVVTGYTYNSRGLLQGIQYTPPFGIADPGDVNFTYDNLGNRTQMTDGMGTVNYTFTALSQVASETRYFTDTLANAPISGNGFALSYTYTLSGQPKTYTDPYGEEIAYSHDKTGRLNTVTGTSYGGVTDYASSPEYRAWGALKHLDYGNGYEIDAEYNNRLQASAFELKKPSTSTTVFDKTYEYYADGKLKKMDDHLGPSELENRLDRLFKYDHTGRVKTAVSGLYAHGGTPTDSMYVPYDQSYSYNAFGNLTDRLSTLWNYTNTDWNFSYNKTNNRTTDSGYSYDAEGNQTAGDDINFEYDAAGKMAKTWRTNAYETTRSSSGDGIEAKRSQRTWNTGTSNWNSWESRFFIYSSVLDSNVAEADTTGKKKFTYVLSGGGVLARQELFGTTETVAWKHADASGLSARGLTQSGGETDFDEELDGLGNNVGPAGNFFTIPDRPENTLIWGKRIAFNNMEMGDCESGGVLGACIVDTWPGDSGRMGWGRDPWLSWNFHSEDPEPEEPGSGSSAGGGSGGGTQGGDDGSFGGTEVGGGGGWSTVHLPSFTVTVKAPDYAFRSISMGLSGVGGGNFFDIPKSIAASVMEKARTDANTALAKKACADLFILLEFNAGKAGDGLLGTGAQSGFKIKSATDKLKNLNIQLRYQGKTGKTQVKNPGAGQWIAHAVIDSSSAFYQADGKTYEIGNTVLVSELFFDKSPGVLFSASVASSAKATNLTADQRRALIVLHELKHLYFGKGHSGGADTDEAWNDEILKACF